MMILTPDHLVLAVARWHGWFDERTNAVQRAHNPGALTHAPARFAQRGEYVLRHGRTLWRGEHHGELIVFQCGGEGFAALENVLRSAWTRGETLAEFLMEHAPGSIAAVCSWLGLPTATAKLRVLVLTDWPVIPGPWKNFPPPGEMPAWPLQPSYLATLGCEADEDCEVRKGEKQWQTARHSRECPIPVF